MAKFRELNASLCDLSERFRDIDGEKGKRLREIVSRVQVAVSSGFYLLKIRFDAAGLAWEEGALPAIPQAEQARLYTEASTLDEMRRLQEMPPITRDSLHECDLDELLKELGDL
ncbi:hypothetical protein MRY87_07070 [bacterium]|nr:hypothetical protein [bacterium]